MHRVAATLMSPRAGAPGLVLGQTCAALRLAFCQPNITFAHAKSTVLSFEGGERLREISPEQGERRRGHRFLDRLQEYFSVVKWRGGWRSMSREHCGRLGFLSTVKFPGRRALINPFLSAAAFRAFVSFLDNHLA